MQKVDGHELAQMKAGKSGFVVNMRDNGPKLHWVGALPLRVCTRRSTTNFSLRNYPKRTNGCGPTARVTTNAFVARGAVHTEPVPAGLTA
jgi:hypothetical protein